MTPGSAAAQTLLRLRLRRILWRVAGTGGSLLALAQYGRLLALAGRQARWPETAEDSSNHVVIKFPCLHSSCRCVYSNRALG